jgi:hypothetical protein
MKPFAAQKKEAAGLISSSFIFIWFFGAFAWAQSPPPGSYNQTCKNTTVQGADLHSSCRERGGGYKSTSLASFALCIGDIKNDDGSLRCSKGEGLVEGSYKSSCRGSAMDNTVLRSSCKEINGPYVASQLDVTGCRGDIANVNGALTCPKGDSDPPAGSYIRSCRDIVTRAGTLSAKCATGERDYKQSSLPFSNCPPNSIMNDNGTLRCSPKAPANNQPTSNQGGGPAFMTICTGASVPGGYIITDRRFDPTICGNPTSNDSKNVETIERYDNLPIGKSLDICVGQPVPLGWAVTATRWNPQTCDEPASNALKNVETIQRTS